MNQMTRTTGIRLGSRIQRGRWWTCTIFSHMWYKGMTNSPNACSPEPEGQLRMQAVHK